jgi:hypothetical protein
VKSLGFGDHLREARLGLLNAREISLDILLSVKKLIIQMLPCSLSITDETS